MRKNLKRLFTLFMCVMASVVAVISVNAEEAPQTLKATNYVLTNTPMSFPDTYWVKKTSDGKYIYCTHYAKKTPDANVTYTRGSLVADNGISYILYQSLNATNDSDFFIYQNALWVYMVDKGLMPQPYYTLTVFNSNVKKGTSATAKRINELVANAKNASATDASAPTINVDASASKFTLDTNGEYYVSNEIKVTSSTGKYTVSLTNAPKGSTLEESGNSFIIKVPADSITSATTNVSFKVSNSKDVYTAYNYTPSSSSYQSMAMAFKNTKTASAEGSLTIKQGGASISKQDITNKEELPGATLVVKDSKGNVIEEWVSTNEPHVIETLKPGTYTLTETVAPDGYVLSTETITFTVKDDGSVTKVVMYNEKQTGSVSISKQDITNKKELPGATLVVKDYDGNVIEEWVSTNEPHIIEGLKPGIYTLTETIAPDGYILSSETITFTVKDDGTITKVVMYNTPDSKEEIPVENTASFKTVTSSLIGVVVVIAGSLMIFKNTKKKENI